MKDKEKNNNKIYYTILAIVALICLAVIVGVFIFNNNNKNKEDLELAYTDLIKKIDNKEVEKIEMTVGSTGVKVKLKDVEKEKTRNITHDNRINISLTHLYRIDDTGMERSQKLSPAGLQ